MSKISETKEGITISHQQEIWPKMPFRHKKMNDESREKGREKAREGKTDQQFI